MEIEVKEVRKLFILSVIEIIILNILGLINDMSLNTVVFLIVFLLSAAVYTGYIRTYITTKIKLVKILSIIASIYFAIVYGLCLINVFMG